MPYTPLFGYFAPWGRVLRVGDSGTLTVGSTLYTSDRNLKTALQHIDVADLAVPLGP